MPWIMCGTAPTTPSASGAADPAHHLRVAAFVDAVLGPRRPGSPSRTRPRRTGRSARALVAAHAVRVRVTGEVAGDAFAPLHHVEQRPRSRRARSRSADRPRALRVEVPRPGGGRTRAPGRSPTTRARRASRPARRTAHHRRGPARWCRAPRASRRGARPRTGRPRRPASGSLIASWLPRTWCRRGRRALRNVARNASYCSGSPRSVRSPLTTTASGSSSAISATAPRPITSGYGGSPGSRRRGSGRWRRSRGRR